MPPLEDNDDSEEEPESPPPSTTLVSGMEEVTSDMKDIDLKGSNDSMNEQKIDTSDAAKSNDQVRAEHGEEDFAP
jgi:hypothetical protein